MIAGQFRLMPMLAMTYNAPTSSLKISEVLRAKLVFVLGDMLLLLGRLSGKMLRGMY